MKAKKRKRKTMLTLAPSIISVSNAKDEIDRASRGSRLRDQENKCAWTCK